MYPGVPITIPVAVTGAEPTACATPKSVIRTVPPGANRMFAGLMSRVNQPRAVRRLQPGRGLRDDIHGPRGAARAPASTSAREGPSISSMTR
jgi:hypothetical protein